MALRALGLPARGAVALLLVLAAVSPAAAHEHGDEHIPEGETITQDPIDATLWVHILLQMFVWGILFPVGMVLGITRSRWHVPVQATGTVLAILGYFLGHMHKGRQFVRNNVHAKAAAPLMFLLAAQVVFGIYLRLHIERGIHGRFLRPAARRLHGFLGKAFPVAAWVQMVFGGITTLGFCQGEHVGQCAAHFIMGGAFIAYGILLTILLVVGQTWLRRTGRSPEFFDSCVIAAWGCVNTFTEHRWGTAWVKNDWQHTTMGIIWWSAGLAGVWLSWSRDGRPQRNFVPGFVILITGWAMSAHPQELMASAATHAMFGYTLMAAGLARIIETAFVLRDRNGVSADGTETNSFQYITPFLLCAAGFLFMGATEEQMLLVTSSSMDHVAYILILYSLAFLVFLFANILIHLYDRSANADLLAKTRRRVLATEAALDADGDAAAAVGAGAGIAAHPARLPNGHARSESHQVRDAEEFELGDLASDDDEHDPMLGDEFDERAARQNLLSKKEAGAGEDDGDMASGLANGNGRVHL